MEMMSQPQFIDEADVFSIGSFQNIICLEVKVRIQDTTKEIFWNILRSELNETYTLEYEHPALPERLKYENMGLMFGRLG